MGTKWATSPVLRTGLPHPSNIVRSRGCYLLTCRVRAYTRVHETPPVAALAGVRYYRARGCQLKPVSSRV